MESTETANWTTVNRPSEQAPANHERDTSAHEPRQIIAGPGDLIVLDRTKLKMLRHPSSDEDREIILVTDK